MHLGGRSPAGATRRRMGENFWRGSARRHRFDGDAAHVHVEPRRRGALWQQRKATEWIRSEADRSRRAQATPGGEVEISGFAARARPARYWQRPETSAQTFVDGWVRTGDLYRQRRRRLLVSHGPQRRLFQTDRASGFRRSKLKACLLRRQDPCARRRWLKGSTKMDCRACARSSCAADDSDAKSSRRSIARACDESALPRFKQPRRYMFVSELPYTATGKVQRFKLREQLRSSEAQPLVSGDLQRLWR